MKAVAAKKEQATGKRQRGRPKGENDWIAFSSRIRVDHDQQLAEISTRTGLPRTRLLEDAITMLLEDFARKRR